VGTIDKVKILNYFPRMQVARKSEQIAESNNRQMSRK